MSWETLQKEIADRYCGTVLVLDDEIYGEVEDKDSKKHVALSEDFLKVKHAFEKRGASCDLWQVDDLPDEGVAWNGVSRALKRCDTVVLDWYLGRGKYELRLADNAIKVLEQLCELPGFRFAAIHSNEAPATIFDQLKERFRDRLKSATTRPDAAADEEEESAEIVEEAAQAESTAPSTFEQRTELPIDGNLPAAPSAGEALAPSPEQSSSLAAVDQGDQPLSTFEQRIDSPVGERPSEFDVASVIESQTEDRAPDARDSSQPVVDQPVQSPSTFLIGDNLYVCILQKQHIANSVAELVDVFYDHLKLVFTDHIHWAGFEFAAKARELLPRLLQCLPKGTDAALSFQALLLAPDELEECVIETLNSELRALVHERGIQAVKDSVVVNRLVSGVVENKELVKTSFERFNDARLQMWSGASVENLKKVFEESETRAFRAALFDYLPSRLEGEVPGGLREHREEIAEFIFRALGNDGDVNTVRASHDSYAALREHLQSVRPKRIWPGVILRKKPGQTVGEWLVCISPVCDCARGDSKRRYLFVGGTTIVKPSAVKAGKMQSCLRDKDGNCYHVQWSSDKFKAVEYKPLDPDKYDFFGSMHHDFLQSLIQAVWRHETRVGVSTSDYLRKERE